MRARVVSEAELFDSELLNNGNGGATASAPSDFRMSLPRILALGQLPAHASSSTPNLFRAAMASLPPILRNSSSADSIDESPRRMEPSRSKRRARRSSSTTRAAKAAASRAAANAASRVAADDAPITVSHLYTAQHSPMATARTTSTTSTTNNDDDDDA